MQDNKVCSVCGTPGCLEARGADFHAGTGFSSKTCDYAGTPPFADAEWANDENAMCLWCAGTGHPYGDESYGMCKCPKPLAGDALQLNCGGVPAWFSEGDRARIQWDEGCSVVSPECTITKVRRLFVVVEFDSEPGAGLDKTQKFTLRKGGKWVAAEWHWVCGIPELVAI